MNQGYNVQLPRLTVINKSFIIAAAALFVLNGICSQALGVSLTQYMGLSLSMFTEGHIYQVLTYPFISGQLLGVVFTCLIMWFIGSELEDLWGQAQYLFLILSSVLLAAITYLLVVAIFFSGSMIVGLPLYGLSGVTSSLCLIYAVLYPDRQFVFMFLFPMKAKYFCMLLIGISLYQGFFSPAGAGAWGHLGAMLGGYVGYKLLAYPQIRRWVAMWDFNVNLSAVKKRAANMHRKQRLKNSNLTVVKDEEEEETSRDDDPQRPPKYWQ